MHSSGEEESGYNNRDRRIAHDGWGFSVVEDLGGGHGALLLSSRRGVGGDELEVPADFGELLCGGEVVFGVDEGAEVGAVGRKLAHGRGTDVLVAPEPKGRVAFRHARAPHPRRRAPPRDGPGEHRSFFGRT
eukprot:CAMPEP_0198654610 /NCGR_PEP_ID=MMETSP1467-20131203/7827_1 /TAXON_ID=1462469 /ORGANISM="unid. sp., Strain CCMP2135" /LENGTH=131 /DNA_ID=CAMNT_0044390601 /DNA_START=145 /DNA_END=540 /DNA_ORIENTATION=+